MRERRGARARRRTSARGRASSPRRSASGSSSTAPTCDRPDPDRPAPDAGWRGRRVVAGPRIGITKAAELPWRFCAVGLALTCRGPWPRRAAGAARRRLKLGLLGARRRRWGGGLVGRRRRPGRAARARAARGPAARAPGSLAARGAGCGAVPRAERLLRRGRGLVSAARPGTPSVGRGLGRPPRGVSSPASACGRWSSFEQRPAMKSCQMRRREGAAGHRLAAELGLHRLEAGRGSRPTPRPSSARVSRRTRRRRSSRSCPSCRPRRPSESARASPVPYCDDGLEQDR